MKVLSRRFGGYLKKDAMLLYKRKKYLYIFILLPLIIATLFLFALSPQNYNIKVGVCDFDNTELSRSSFASLHGFDPVVFPVSDCSNEVIKQIKSGQIDIGVEVPAGFASNIESLKQANLVVYYDNTDIAFSNLISWKVDLALNPFKRQVVDSLNTELSDKISSVRGGVDLIFDLASLPSSLGDRVREADSDLEALEEMDTEFLVNPINTEKRPIYEAGMKKDAGVVFIFPILAIFITLMLASTSIIYDKKTNFITRVKASASPFSYILAKTLFFTALVFVQFVIILLLFMLSGAQYALPVVPLLMLILSIGIIDTLIGFIIGLVANNEGIAVLFSLMISFPLMLVSGIFFPVQALPGIVRWISSVLPLHHQINAAKSVLLFGQSFSNSWIYFAVGMLLLVYWLIRKN
jgi:ABC-2 type transport system permease protein